MLKNITCSKTRREETEGKAMSMKHTEKLDEIRQHIYMYHNLPFCGATVPPPPPTHNGGRLHRY